MQSGHQYLEPLLDAIARGDAAERALEKLSTRQQPAAIVDLPTAIQVQATSGAAAWTPIAVWREDDPAQTPLTPGTLVPTRFRSKLRWETRHSTVDSTWPVFRGTLHIGTERTTGPLPEAHCWQHTTAGAIESPVPDLLQSRAVPVLASAELHAELERRVQQHAEARMSLVLEYQPLIRRILQQTLVPEPVVVNDADLQQEASVVLLDAINRFASPQRPPVSFSDYLAKRIKTRVARMKPAGIHEDTARAAIAAANTDPGTTAEDVAATLADLTRAASPKRARPAQPPTQRQIATASRGQIAAANGYLAPTSLDQPLSGPDTTGTGESLRETLRSDASDELFAVSLHFWLDLAKDMTVQANFDHYHALASGLLALAITNDVSGNSRWQPELFSQPVMFGFINAFDPFAGNRRWSSPRHLNAIRADIAEEIGFINCAARPPQEVADAWRQRLDHRSYAGRPALPFSARKACVAAAVEMTKAVFPAIAVQLQTHHDQQAGAGQHVATSKPRAGRPALQQATSDPAHTLLSKQPRPSTLPPGAQSNSPA